MRREYIRYQVDSHIATVVIDRPPVNAINLQLREELNETFRDLNSNGEIWAVILTGTQQLFSAGADINELNLDAPSNAIPRNTRWQEIFKNIGAFRAPVIAAINGYALGGGLELAMACDIRIAAKDAKLGLPEITLGGVAGAGGPQRFSRLHTGFMRELLFTGNRILATKAYQVKLVDELAEPGCAQDAARKIAERIVSRPPLSVQALKRTISLGRDVPLERAIEFDLLFSGEVATTADRIESVHAFLEKRTPLIQGQ